MRWQNPSPTNARLQLVRPLLDISKAELTAYAGAHKIPFREDASNRSPEFLRNRVRNELLPLLRQYQPGLDQTVPRLMAIMQAEGEYLDDQARRWLAAPSQFVALPLALQRRVLGLQLLGLEVIPDFELIETLRSQPGAKVTGPGGKALRLNADGMIVELQAGAIPFSRAACHLHLDRQGIAQFAGRQFEWEIQPCRSPGLPAKRSAGVEWFDAGSIGQNIVLRHWCRGDRFQPIGAAQPVKLQDFFTNEKVPAAERHQRVVGVAEDGRIFWVEGLRISECFKLDKAARFTLQWQWRLVS
jgi:tRNA(Ile)-lysidine synthase